MDLENAVASGDEQPLINFLNTKPDLDLLHGLIHKAALHGYIHIVEILLNYGVNIEERATIDGLENVTPLMIGCIEGHVDIVEFLIKKGAIIDCQCLSDTCQSNVANVTDIIDLLFQSYKGILVSLINSRDEFGMTPLTMALYGKYSGPIIDRLIIHGADLNYGTDDGVTPLMILAENNRENLLELLLSYGCNINECDNNGDTALIIACKNKSRRCINVLVDHNADVDIVNNDGKSAIDYTRSKKVSGLLLSKSNVFIRR